MAFIMDKQTFADLEILDIKGVKNSIFGFFDKAISHGGRKELINMFHYPLSNRKEIVERQELIRYVQKKKLPFTIDKYLLNFIELYLETTNKKPVKVSRLDAWNKAFNYMLKPSTEYYIIQRGIKQVIEFLQELYLFATENFEPNSPHLLEQHFCYIAESIENTQLNRIIGFNTKKRISVINRERFDYIFRYCEHDRLKTILKVLYQIDAFHAVADTATELGLVFPEMVDNNTIEIIGLYHPFVKKAVVNDVRLNENGNMFFITGANMAGKSTFLKAFGIAVYLAHIGFPVAANSMRTGVYNGLFSTINMADSLNKGYSHFYSEVLRVKRVAEEINQTKNLVVIFDELFRGTNVKDAYDASLAIISAFANVKGSVFLVSTHIMEVADQLKKLHTIRFGYFHTVIEGKTFVNSYHLLEGVTEERLGMLIIENERIVETIKDSYKSND
jgi:DNA mismatch repair ATPase MutS